MIRDSSSNQNAILQITQKLLLVKKYGTVDVFKNLHTWKLFIRKDVVRKSAF